MSGLLLAIRRTAASTAALLLLLGTAFAFAVGELTIATADGARHEFRIEIARSSAEKNQGLMFRQALAEDAGMLFDWPDRPVATMWMKNTFIPLDMLFIDADGRIVHIARRTVPHSLETVTAGRRVRAVLELRGGTADRRGIAVGDRVIHPIFEND
ncbi:MAG: DUF192 domain-containing protein [Acetobacterales bacterium]